MGSVSVRATSLRVGLAKVVGFLWQLLQMVLAMVAGMMVYHVLIRHSAHWNRIRGFSEAEQGV